MPQYKDRFAKALKYFRGQTQQIKEQLQSFAFTTDNKAIQKDIDRQYDKLQELLSTKLFFFAGIKEEFNVQRFLELRANSVFLVKDKPKAQRKTVIDGTSNVELYELLRLLRNDIAQREDLIHYQIFTQKSLYAMCELLPMSKQDLKAVHGMGKTRIEKYGEEIVEVNKKLLRRERYRNF